jgi:gluconolactonase
MNLLVRDFVLPNGLAFSPDERIFYINDSQGVLVREDIFRSVGHIKACDVRSNGMLANGRVFCELRGERTGIPDGMKVDVEGHVYCTGPGGVWIMDASGKHLGTILTGVAHTTNIAWGGADWKTLYITTPASLARIQLKIAGIPVPRSR